MFRVLLSVLVAVAAVLSYALAPVNPQLTSLATIRGAVKELKAVNDEGVMANFCSGVLIDEHTVLTAAHCDIGRDIFVGGFKVIVARKDEKRDLMLLYLPIAARCPCVRQVATPSQDERVYAVGFPLDKGQVLTVGAYQSNQPDGFILFTAAVTWGNSGGGVFVRTDGGWALVGIVSRGTVIPFMGMIPVFIGHLNLAAGPKSINDFLRGE